jgi:hypothetical protein
MTTRTEDQEFDGNAHDANRDAITGAPGSHPVGSGVGATGVIVAGDKP